MKTRGRCISGSIAQEKVAIVQSEPRLGYDALQVLHLHIGEVCVGKFKFLEIAELAQTSLSEEVAVTGFGRQGSHDCALANQGPDALRCKEPETLTTP